MGFILYGKCQIFAVEHRKAIIMGMSPHKDEYASFYEPYITKAQSADLPEALELSCQKNIAFFKGLTEAQCLHRYQAGKWSIKEIILHLIDSERVFAYRMLRISRSDETPLPGFDQDAYVPASNADSRSIESLLEEYAAVRKASLCFIRSLDESQLSRKGTASGWPVSVRALINIIYGHEAHHMAVIEERYI